MFGQQVDVLLCHAPVPPYAVKAAYQHHIHLSGKDGLCDLFQARTVKGQAVALLGGSADNGISRLFRIAAKLGGLCFKRKAVIVGHTAVFGQVREHRQPPGGSHRRAAGDSRRACGAAKGRFLRRKVRKNYLPDVQRSPAKRWNCSVTTA